MKIRRQRGRALLLLAIGLIGLVGCSSGGGSAAPTATTTAAPEEQVTTPAAVAAGLRTIDELAKGIAASASTDKARAESLAHQIEPAWKPIEGTVKQNDQNTYLAMEDSFAVLEKAADDGDGAEAAKGSAAVSSAVQAYLAKYSG